MSVFGERLKLMRKEAGITQTELGEKLNLKLRMIQYLESGDREPNLETLNLIASIFGCTVDYLLGRTDDPQGKKNVTWKEFHEIFGLVSAIVETEYPDDAKALMETYKKFPSVDEEVDKERIKPIADILNSVLKSLETAMEEARKTEQE